MAFFEDLGKKLSGVGQSAVQKTQNATDSIRLNNQINEEERKINAAYLNIGKRYVELHGSKMEPEFSAWIQEIEGCQQRINECRVQVRRNKGLTVCTNCGAEIPEMSPFCKLCGAKNVVAEQLAAQRAAEEEAKRQAEAERQAAQAAQARAWAEQQAAAAAANRCSKCGHPLNPGTAFCTNCGAPVAAPAAATAPTPTPAPAAPTPAAAPAAEAICKKCGKPLATGAAFCTNCGTKVE